MSWLSAAPALFVALAISILPGMPAAWVLRFRGLTFIAASITASFALIAVTTVLTPFFGMSWGILPVLAVAVLFAVLLLPLRRFTQPSVDAPGHTKISILTTGGAILVAAVLIGSEITRAIGDLEHISQTFDAVFHLNAVAEIISTANASPLDLNLTSTALFYPTLWHAIVSLVAQLSGASVPLATNAAAIIISAWVWPVAILFFSRPFFVRRPAHLLLGAVLASVFTAFPYLLLTWGVLYPNLLSTALIPFALGFLYLALRTRTVGAGVPTVSLWVAAIGAVGAATLAHPNAAFGIAAFTLPIFIVVANDVRRSNKPLSNKLTRWGLLLAAVVAYTVMWRVLTTSEARAYESGSPLQGLLSALTNAPLADTRAWFLSVLVLGGIVVLLIGKKHRWLIGSYLIAVGLYTIAVGFSGPLRDFITGPWYSDAARLAALLPIAAIPLAGAAAAMLLDLVTDGLQSFDQTRVSEKMRPLLPLIGAVVVFALVLTGGRGSNIPVQSGWMAGLYEVNDGPILLSEDEMTLLNRLHDEVSEDALIAGDPWSGTSLALAFSGRSVLFPHLQGNSSQEAMELADRFSSMQPSESCTLLNHLGIDYMLGFGGPLYDIGNPDLAKPYDGLRFISNSPVLERIDQEGKASLYRVTC